MKSIHVYSDKNSLVEAAASFFIETASIAIQNKGLFNVVLSGGGTPQPLFEYLAENQSADFLDWARIHFFWGDERTVGPSDPQSNYRQANRTLLQKRMIQPRNIHRIEGELDPSQAAALYQKEIVNWIHGSPPSFDLIFLGMGEDGHTASLFPGSKVVSYPADFDLVAANHVPQLETWRITLTPKLINAANKIIFLVSGENKASILKQVLEGPYQPEVFPAQLIRPQNGKLIWLIEQGSASLLRS